MLIWNLLVKGDKSVEIIPCQRNQFAITLSLPSHVINCSHFVFRQIMSKIMRHVFIEQ